MAILLARKFQRSLSRRVYTPKNGLFLLFQQSKERSRSGRGNYLPSCTRHPLSNNSGSHSIGIEGGLADSRTWAVILMLFDSESKGKKAMLWWIDEQHQEERKVSFTASLYFDSILTHNSVVLTCPWETFHCSVTSKWSCASEWYTVGHGSG